MEKRDNEIFMQSPGCRYLAMSGKQLRRETTSVEERISSTANPRYRARKKVGCIGRKQEYSNQERGTYISCSRQNTNSVFGRVLYLRERTAT